MWYDDPMLSSVKSSWYAFCLTLIRCGYQITQSDYILFLTLTHKSDSD